MESQDLRAQVRRAARGDEQAAGALFDRYYPRVYRYARARLGTDVEAEDVASETFARVLKGIADFKWKGAGFEAWLFRIASNLVVDARRAAGRQHPSGDVPEDATPVEHGPEDVTLRKEVVGDVRDVLAKLPPDQREVLILRFAAELDTHEVGRVMNRNPNAVRQLQFRALTGMRRMMGAEEATP